MAIVAEERKTYRLAQVDSRRRVTIPELEPNSRYTVDIRDDKSVVLVPLSVRRAGRQLNVDSRRRIQMAEISAWGLYFVVPEENGIVILVPAVALALREANRLKRAALLTHNV